VSGHLLITVSEQQSALYGIRFAGNLTFSVLAEARRIGAREILTFDKYRDEIVGFPIYRLFASFIPLPVLLFEFLSFLGTFLPPLPHCQVNYFLTSVPNLTQEYKGHAAIDSGGDLPLRYTYTVLSIAPHTGQRSSFQSGNMRTRSS